MVIVKTKILLFIVYLLVAAAVLVIVFVLPASHVGPVENQENEELTIPSTWFQGEDESTWPYLPWLHTEGNRIVDETGNTVVLRGVNIEDPWRFYNYEEALKPKVFRVLAENWNANVVRIPVYPAQWETQPALFSDYYDHVIRACHKYGLYVVLDWHFRGQPITGETGVYELMWPSRTSLEETQSAWNQMAERYKDNSWVIYDIVGEPTDLDGRLTALPWENWKSTAENLIDIIRSHNPKALILVSGYKAASDLRPVATDPIDRDNIVYAAHVYPEVEVGEVRNENKELMWEMLDNYIGFVAENYPLMISEWGYDYAGQYYYDYPDFQGTTQNFGSPLMEWLNTGRPQPGDFWAYGNLSWTGWVWSANWVPPMIIDWEHYTPNEFGKLVKMGLAGGFDEWVPGKLIVKFEPGIITMPPGRENATVGEVSITSPSIVALNQEFGVTMFEKVFEQVTDNESELFNWYILTLPIYSDIPEVALRYEQDPDVLSAQSNYIYHAA